MHVSQWCRRERGGTSHCHQAEDTTLVLSHAERGEKERERERESRSRQREQGANAMWKRGDTIGDDEKRKMKRKTRNKGRENATRTVGCCLLLSRPLLRIYHPAPRSAPELKHHPRSRAARRATPPHATNDCSFGERFCRKWGVNVTLPSLPATANQPSHPPFSNLLPPPPSPLPPLLLFLLSSCLVFAINEMNSNV